VSLKGYTEALDLPEDFFTSIEGLLKSLELTRLPHWLRVFYSQYNHQMAGVEVLLDNEPWPEAQDRIAKLPWPSLAQYYSARLFLTLVPPGV
jgi:hypothetical protein